MDAKVVDVKVISNWREVADAARVTVDMKKGSGESSDEWKLKMLYAEHSPIRLIKVRWRWEKLKYWSSTHFVRHHVGYEPFVQSQRDDKEHTEYDERDDRPQGAKVKQYNEANLQALIDISRDRLCRQTHGYTRYSWLKVIHAVSAELPEMRQVCVAECVYRGFCPEPDSCGLVDTDAYEASRRDYVDTAMEVKA